MTPATQPAQQLHQLETAQQLRRRRLLRLACACRDADLAGSWREGVETGHPIDGLLELLGWHGKRFSGPEGAYPLVFQHTKGGALNVNPAAIPIGFVVRHPIYSGTRWRAGSSGHPACCCKLSGRGAAGHDRYRGVVSATMIYDPLPINDVSRKVDEDCVLVNGHAFTPQPFFFVLRREGRPTLLTSNCHRVMPLADVAGPERSALFDVAAAPAML